jgi:hypothetical protein
VSEWIGGLRKHKRIESIAAAFAILDTFFSY